MSAAFTARIVAGLGLLLRLDIRAFALLGETPADAARSFWAAVVLAPLYLLYMLLEFQGGAGGSPFGPYGLLKLLHYVLGWALYPVMMEILCRLLDRRALFYRWLAAYNWLQVPVMLAFLPLTGLAAFGLAPLPVVAFLNSLVFLVMTFYLGVVARGGLRVPMITVVGVVFLDLIVGEALHEAFLPLLLPLQTGAQGVDGGF
ncbi:hypothetical protein [Pararhodospirillum photometricum]|uniref:Uncharacterized protein n=1 Tax=Pararhodospirillum photometricum DSM 122 TaxID=1150469 RepID=H6SRE1_PARPM|nr:hypothetical protein [Pararhodospirillum photometricum]CCG07470.1 Putative uncharacterized protein [Pararhodospirillum photometricum DSM 122]